MQGLFRRGGTWHARLVVPERLRALAGRAEFVRSTRCSDLATAKLVHAAFMAAWRRQLYELESCQTVTDDELRRLTNPSPVLAMQGHLALKTAHETTGLTTDALLNEAAAGRLRLFARVPDHASRGFVMSFEDWVERGTKGQTPVRHGLAGRVLELLNLLGDGAAVLLADGADEAVIQAFSLEDGRIYLPDGPARVPVNRLLVDSGELETVRRRWAGAVSADRLARLNAPAGMLPGRQAPENVGGGGGAGKSISEGVRAYLAAPDGLQGRTDSVKEIAQRQRCLQRFGDHCGNKPLGRVTDDDLRSFRAWVRTWPGGNLKGELQRDTWEQTIAAAKDAGWPTMSEGAVAERVIWVRQFFKWLHAGGRLEMEVGRTLAGESGLTKAQRIELARESELAKPEGGSDAPKAIFSPAEIASIFAQPQFINGDGRHAHGRRVCDPHEYWVPLLALLHGLRLREVCQLTLECVREIDGTWCLDINARAPDRRVKSNAKGKVQMVTRMVPLHSLAIQLGLLRYIEALRVAGYRRLFPDLRWGGQDDGYGREAGRKFTETKKKLELSSNVSFHSFRHLANDKWSRVQLPGMDAGLQMCVRYKATGHKLPSEDVNAKHYTHVKLDDVAKLIEARTLEGLPEISPFDVDWGLSAVAVAVKKRHGGIEQNGPAD